DIDRVGLRLLAGQIEGAPFARGRAVAVELAAVPARDPQFALRVRPDAAQPGVLMWRLDHLDRTVGSVHFGKVATGERDVPDFAVGSGVDAVGPTSLWIVPHRHLAR